MDVVIGWDIGGAHLKAARVEGSRVVATRQAATPLWLGLQSLEAAFDRLNVELGPADRHAITMTGELCDAFPSRREGVAGLAALAERRLAPSPVSLYAGRAGFVGPEETAECALDIASANWLASASVVARKLDNALLVDLGSTTTDIVPVVAGRVAAVGYSDSERLKSGELVYVGLTRSFIMAMAARAPFRGVWTPLMNEYFANSADVFRVLRALPADVDLMAAADGGEKTVEASRMRLARMIGLEADEAPAAQWEALAAWFAEALTRDITDAAFLRLSRCDLPKDAPVVAAGVGGDLVAETARRLRRGCIDFCAAIEAPREAGRCAPAVAVALLAAAEQGGEGSPL